MTRAWWPLGCAAAFFFCVSAGTAGAQTFIVRSAPAGSDVEVTFGTAAGKGTAGETGDATIVLTNSPAATEEVAAAIYTDLCGTTVRLILVGRSADPPPPGAGCARRAVPGYFVFRPETSAVVDIAPGVPIVRIRQGRVPDSWLREGPIPTGSTAPRGLVVFGGGGFGTMPETVDLLCGNSSPCARENTKLTFMGGVAYWLTPWLGGESTFMKPLEFEVTGSGNDYEMVGSVDPRLVTISALGAWPIKAARFYARIGGTYHRTIVETTQATFGRVISQDGITSTFPASTQTFRFATLGWSPHFGGGVEGWVSDSAAIFAEVWFMEMKANSEELSGGERIIDDRLRSVVAGVKIHIGHRR
jgi:hypothetical protein